MARRQRHFVHVGHVPGTDDESARIRITLDLLDHLTDLINVAPVRRRPTAPLVAVDRPQLAIFVGPFIPDADLVLL